MPLDFDTHTSDSRDSSMLRRSEYDAALDVYFVLAYRKATLETEYDRETLADHPEYRDIRERLARFEEYLDGLFAALSPAEAYAVAENTDGFQSSGIDHIRESIPRSRLEE